MLARCIPSILPPLTGEERREVSAIYSVAGMLEQGKLLAKRPFVSPHHTVTPYALAGSGSVPRPGMVTLAHRGVLFLDEMAEFKRSTLDILRQPMEEGRIFLAKSAGTFVYPASFLLVAATNPCPSGYYPDRNDVGAAVGSPPLFIQDFRAAAGSDRFVRFREPVRIRPVDGRSGGKQRQLGQRVFEKPGAGGQRAQKVAMRAPESV